MLTVGVVLAVAAALQLPSAPPAAQAVRAAGVGESVPPYQPAPAVTNRGAGGQGSTPSTQRSAQQPERAAQVRHREQEVRAGAVPGVPRRVLIPQLGVRAPVVGITAPGGTLTPPSDAQTLGWWSDGARPGSLRGSALVTGHTVSTGGGALDDLEQLAAGDAVVVRSPRAQVRYVVRQVSIYRKASLARHADTLFSQDVPGRLVLITCEDWDGEKYLSNVVVIAEPAPR